jgi:fluoroacetyl-CoA thioesterase
MKPARSTAGGSADDPLRPNQYDGAMRPIPVGAKGTFTLRVTPARLANQFKDAMLPPVFATPMMIMAMENAALNAIRAYLEPGESAVGTAVDVRHLAATPVGHDVTAEAEVTRVDGRRVEFNVTARDEKEEIGRGTHERMVIDMRRLDQRLSGKSKANDH